MIKSYILQNLDLENFWTVKNQTQREDRTCKFSASENKPNFGPQHSWISTEFELQSSWDSFQLHCAELVFQRFPKDNSRIDLQDSWLILIQINIATRLPAGPPTIYQLSYTSDVFKYSPPLSRLRTKVHRAVTTYKLQWRTALFTQVTEFLPFPFILRK